MEAGLKQKVAEYCHVMLMEEAEKEGKQPPYMKNWNTLPKDLQGKLIANIERFERALGKEDLVIVGRKAVEKGSTDTRALEAKLTAFLKEFMLRITQPKGVAAFFPYDELTKQLVGNFTLAEPKGQPKVEENNA